MIDDLSEEDAAVKHLGGVDVLVDNVGNAGGVGRPGMKPFAEADPADWEPFLRVNLYGIMNCVRAAPPHMIAKGYDRIVTMQAKALMRRYMIRRPGDPSDPAGLTAYLASPMASWITGQTFPVNGGYSVGQ